MGWSLYIETLNIQAVYVRYFDHLCICKETLYTVYVCSKAKNWDFKDFSVMWGVSVWSSDLFSNTHRWLMWKILNVIVSIPLSIPWDCSLKAERNLKEAKVISRIRQAVPEDPV